MTTKIDLNRIWDDARAMAAANAELLAVLAGMFVMLPMILSLQLIEGGAPTAAAPPPESFQALLDLYVAEMQAHWPVLLGRELVAGFGMLAMLVLLLRENRPTVGESLRLALMLLPGYLLAEMLEGMMLALAFMAFVLPFIYLLARLVLVPAVAAAERQANPIALLRRSFVLTRGNGWRIVLMLAVLFLTTQLAVRVVVLMISILGSLLLPDDLAVFAEHVAVGVMTGLVGILSVLMTAAIYRATGMRRDAPLSAW